MVMLTMALTMLAGGVQEVRAAAGYEKQPVLQASQLAPAELLKGPRFHVDEKVPTDHRRQWIRQLIESRGKNRTAVAVANKNARMVWVLLSRQQDYRPVTTLKTPYTGSLWATQSTSAQFKICTRGRSPSAQVER